jgi:predicted TIM-barrel fold metal-dependent hydrolase
MDLDGVQAQLGFPTMPGFAGRVFLGSDDKELGLLCVQAYNNFNIDEWCASHPDRFIPMIILPLWDPELCQTEIERCAAKGAKAIAFPENPAGLGLPSLHSGHWEPVLAAAQAARTPLCMHFGTSTQMPFVSPDAPWPVSIALMGSNSASSLVELLFSPVFHKFPGLKVALSEGGIGWIPWMLERMDYTWERHMYYTDIDRSVRPSELFRDHIYGCYIDDEAGLELRHRIGVRQITWECDYPHSDSAWPHSRKRVAETLLDVPDEEVHRIVELNAREVFGFSADLDSEM